jgi:hypothetical protein
MHITFISKYNLLKNKQQGKEKEKKTVQIGTNV